MLLPCADWTCIRSCLLSDFFFPLLLFRLRSSSLDDSSRTRSSSSLLTEPLSSGPSAASGSKLLLDSSSSSSGDLAPLSGHAGLTQNHFRKKLIPSGTTANEFLAVARGTLFCMLGGGDVPWQASP